MREIYLDNNATTPLLPEVREAMEPFLGDCYGNPSSVHRLGVEAARALERAREDLREALGLPDFEVVFTSGGTEANNLAVLGARRARPGGRGHLVATAVEHASVLGALRRLAESGDEVTLVGVDREARVRGEELWAALRPDAVLLSILQVNNETGTVQEVDALAAEAKRRCPRVRVHVDGVQALGKAPLSLQHVDLFSGSAHKVHGPKGAGFLAIRRGTPLKPLLEGGGHEGGLRAGTQNVAGAVGLARAVTIAVREQPAAARALAPLRDRLRRGLEELEARLNSPADGVPHTTNASFPGIPGEVMLRALEARAVYVSTASACTSRKRARSHVLAAMGLESELADSAIRMSFSRLTTAAEVDATLEALADVRRELFVPAGRTAQGGGGRWSR